MSALTNNPEFEQGTTEWLQLRKTKITATDAAVILGLNPWKTPYQLYQEKISDEFIQLDNQDMQRGRDLEPIARDLFNIRMQTSVFPQVLVKEWTMASFDGLSEDLKIGVEIKCPGKKDHAMAENGIVPEYYYPQLQHQMHTADLDHIYYFSFDGIDGISIRVERDEDFIRDMLEKEKVFYDNLMNKIPPPLSEKDVVENDNPFWKELASEWNDITNQIKELEEKEKILREKLIAMCGDKSTKGAGISVCRYTRKGNVDYSKIEALKNIDLDQYRKPDSINWKITST